jgi:flagellar biosynthesis protein FlhA
MKISAGMIGVFGLMPGMPLLPFAVLSGGLWYLGRIIERQTEADQAHATTQNAAPSKAHPGATSAGASAALAPAKPGAIGEEFKKLIALDLFSIEIGHGLLPLADVQQGGDLLARVTGVRKTLAREKGLVVPPVAVRDNLELEPNEYRFLLRGKPTARGHVQPNRHMAMNVAGSTVKIRGLPAREPVFGLEAVWIDEAERKSAELNGYTVVDPASVMITHLSETLKGVAHLLLGRQEVQSLVDHLKETHPALVTELLPDVLGLGVIQRVLQNLLRENISILNLPLILEGMADFAALTKNPDDLSELVRRRLGLYFVPELEARPGVLKATTLDPRLEQVLGSKIHRSPGEVGLALDPLLGRHLLQEINARVAEFSAAGLAPAIIVGAELRLPLRRFFEASLPRLAVLAYQELPPATEIENTGIISLPSGYALPRAAGLPAASAAPALPAAA